MIGIFVGFIYFIFVCILNRLVLSKLKHPKFWIILCMIGSLILGCLFVLLYSNQTIEELNKCIYITVPLILIDKLFDKPDR